MKAIETTWKGYRFRSRTEARWAVFFDAAGIQFEYEPEGVILKSGPYLPDFRLRLYTPHYDEVVEHHVYVEVKGEAPDRAAIDRAEELCSAAGDRDGGVTMLVAVGAPDTTFTLLPVVPASIHPNKALTDEVCRFVASNDGAIGVELVCQPGHLNYLGYRTPADLRAAHDFRPAAQFPPWLQRAYDAARGARFEFGQTDKRWET